MKIRWFWQSLLEENQPLKAIGAKKPKEEDKFKYLGTGPGPQ